MKIAIAQKIGMTQIIKEDGSFKGVTVLKLLPNQVSKIEKEIRGYSAVKLSVSKENNPLSKYKEIISEFRATEEEMGDLGETIDASVFELGDKIKVSSVSKGKGFEGTIKRHNFSRGPMTHGSHNRRRPGSIGAMYPQHVFKGMKMAGRMGFQNVTIKNQTIEFIDVEAGVIAVNGSVAGPKKALVKVFI